MREIALLTTGGTIASQEGERGLVPSLGSSEILGAISGHYPQFRFAQRDLMSLDSSNIQPEHWPVIARGVLEELSRCCGVIVTHGTDTMAYTAAALSFMLRNLGKSVVLTGSQIPIEHPLTDAASNLHTAIAAIECGIAGVTVAFDHKIIAGTRAVKTSTMAYGAFESVGAPPMAQAMADGMRVRSPRTAPFDPALPTYLESDFCHDVFLLKLLPGTKPELLDALPGLGYRGLVIEAFGAGGVHNVGRDLPAKIERLIKAGVAVVVCSQCLHERVDLSIYEVGVRMQEIGVVSAHDMTTEAAVTKLMWALGKTRALSDIAKIFATNYAGEVTL